MTGEQPAGAGPTPVAPDAHGPAGQAHGPAPDARAAARIPDDGLRIGTVHVAVSDLDRSVRFYESILGLPLITRGLEEAILGPDRERPLLALTRLSDPVAAPPRSTGLFHVALLHPTRSGLAETVLRLATADWPLTGASDHGVSEALYLDDPDGLGIEVYVDRPREQWPRPPSGRGVAMVTEPLDLHDLLAQAGAATPRIERGTSVGHVHLKVADVERSRRFYADTLGLAVMAEWPSAAFLAAGGYHHHFGLNDWQSAGGSPAPDRAPGLRLVELELPSLGAVDALADRARLATPAAGRRVDSTLYLHDPDGTALAIRGRSELAPGGAGVD